MVSIFHVEQTVIPSELPIKDNTAILKGFFCRSSVSKNLCIYVHYSRQKMSLRCVVGGDPGRGMSVCLIMMQ